MAALDRDTGRNPGLAIAVYCVEYGPDCRR
jgi:hypothetical protein